MTEYRMKTLEEFEKSGGPNWIATIRPFWNTYLNNFLGMPISLSSELENSLNTWAKQRNSIKEVMFKDYLVISTEEEYNNAVKSIKEEKAIVERLAVNYVYASGVTQKIEVKFKSTTQEVITLFWFIDPTANCQIASINGIEKLLMAATSTEIYYIFKYIYLNNLSKKLVYITVPVEYEEQLTKLKNYIEYTKFTTPGGKVVIHTILQTT